jgi:GST-like protein
MADDAGGRLWPNAPPVEPLLTVKNEADRRYGIERYSKDTRRRYGVLDKRLGEAKFVGGDISIGDFSQGDDGFA